MNVGCAQDLRAGSSRIQADLKPEAVPDTAVAEAGRRLRIDVLANDIGLPVPGQPPPELRIEGAPSCGTAEVEGRVVVYTGQVACIGPEVRFGYSVKVGEESVSALVSVSVKAAGEVPPAPVQPDVPQRAQPDVSPQVQPVAAPCAMPGVDWAAVPIAGGTFSKADAPSAITDLVEFLDEPRFTVRPFCITVEPAPAEVVNSYFSRLTAQEIDEQFPEMRSTASVSASQPDQTQRMPARVSQNMAQSFAKWAGARSGRQVSLPSLEEYVAAAWTFQQSEPRTPEADRFLNTLRRGNLQWTRSACGAPGNFWLIGSGAQGRLVKLCYERSRLDRTSFRLSSVR